MAWSTDSRVASRSSRTAAETRALLAETQHRQIVVTAQESSVDMDMPVEERSVSDTVILTTADLAAREVEGLPAGKKVAKRPPTIHTLE